MNVFVKFNIGTSDRRFPPLKEGEQEVDGSVGEALVACGYAEELPSKIKAVPSAPEINGVKDDEPPVKKSKK